MNILDNLKQIKKIDSGKVLESIEMLGEQVNQVWQEMASFKIPKDYKKINKVLINGMGGSALGAHIVRSVFYDYLKVPLGIIGSYKLPASLDKKTLYIISSYSGNTEEPLAEILRAKKVGAKIFGITSGGKLAVLIKRKKIPGYIFDDPLNPSKQPRMGLGYTLSSLLGLFKKLALLKISNQEIKRILNELNKFQSEFGVYNPVKNNFSKILTQKLKDKIPIIVASEFLGGNAHTLANQLNENAKNFSCYFLISELNHHLLEGLAFPGANQKNLCFLFFESLLYHPRNLKRYQITQKVAAKNKINYLIYRLQAKDKLNQAFEFLLLGSYLSFYLAILNQVNPAKIPFVDYFKKELEEIS